MTHDDAETWFAAAAATHERLGAPHWLARTRLERARMLLARGAAGDAERARELLGQALATARELSRGTSSHGRPPFSHERPSTSTPCLMSIGHAGLLPTVAAIRAIVCAICSGVTRGKKATARSSFTPLQS